ncbi:hypothetical protein FHX69_1054 [Prauserella muralis]|nr:hypothetical protein FHX69_1054 [Prauserella muralis]
MENSSAGLFLLAAETTVAVTREEHHQQVLARYPVAEGGQRHVAVELGWCVIGAGRYRGEYAVEVRLDGVRVGELTYAMSQRYGPLIGQVTEQGGRPGCEALIRRGGKGLEMVLRLPRRTEGTAVFPAAGAGAAAATTPMPAVASDPPSRGGFRWKRPLWIAAAVAGAFLVIAAISSILDPATPTSGDPGSLTTTAAAPTTTVASTPPSPEAAPPPPETKPPAPPVTKPPAPKPPPAPQPPPRPQPEPAPEPEPAPPPPAPECDPNYTGCVPVASDVDCAGGSGNGPAYVSGPVRVVGSDVYDLDRDGDGIACDS